MALGLDGHEAVLAESPSAALIQLQNSRPDVIVLDLDLPDESGRSFFRVIQNRADRPPVLVLAPFDARSEQEKMGAEASLAKPLDPVELSRMVGELASVQLP